MNRSQISPLSFLRPRRGTYVDALLSFRDADYCNTIASLESRDDPESTYLRARSWLRLSNAEAAIRELGSVVDSDLPFIKQRAELAVLKASAYVFSADLQRARETLCAARVFAFSCSTIEVQAEYHYVEATSAFAERNFEASTAAAAEVFEIDERFAQRSESYVIPYEHTRARAHSIIGLVLATQEDYKGQHARTSMALRELGDNAVPDIGLSALLLQQLAYLVRDFDLNGDALSLARCLESGSWPADLPIARYEICRALAWHASLRGDRLNAFRYFREAIDIAPNLPFRILASVDQISVSRELAVGERSAESLKELKAQADCVDWSTVAEERIALLLLAQEYSYLSPDVAGRLLERYRSISVKLAPTFLNAYDRRPRAHEQMAEGSVAKANGNVHRAAACFLEAFEIWNRLDYKWRAAVAAAELGRLSGNHRFVEYARREAAARPGSWLDLKCSTLRNATADVIELSSRIRPSTAVYGRQRID